MKLSIVVPVYNRELYVERCLKSIQKIKSIDVECIIINDGSCDNTATIIDEFEINDKRFKTVHINNSGVSAARNRGIAEATGDALFFIDADDWLLETAENLLFEAITKIEEGTITVFSHINVCPSGKKNEYTFPIVADMDYKSALKELIVKNQKLNNCWGILFNKRIIDDFHILFDCTMKIAEDTCFVLDYLMHAESICVCQSPILAYWQNDAGAMRHTDVMTVIDDEKCFVKRNEVLEHLDIKLKDEEYGYMCNYYFSNTIGYISSECNKKTVTEVRTIVKKYVTSSYGKELINSCYWKSFSLSKKILVAALRMKMYTICCLLLFLFEIRKTKV